MTNEELSLKLTKATAEMSVNASMVMFYDKGDKHPMFAVASTAEGFVLLLVEEYWDRATKEQADLVMVEAHLRGLA